MNPLSKSYMCCYKECALQLASTGLHSPSRHLVRLLWVRFQDWRRQGASPVGVSTGWAHACRPERGHDTASSCAASDEPAELMDTNFGIDKARFNFGDSSFMAKIADVDTLNPQTVHARCGSYAPELFCWFDLPIDPLPGRRILPCPITCMPCLSGWGSHIILLCRRLFCWVPTPWNSSRGERFLWHILAPFCPLDCRHTLIFMNFRVWR